MIVTTCGTAGKSKDRFVRKDWFKQDVYVWCERDTVNKRRDTAQGTCNGADLPESILKVCEKHTGAFYACAWPHAKEGKK